VSVRFSDKGFQLWTAIMTNDIESFEKKGLDFNTAVGPQAFSDSVVSKTQGAG
jgi:hypothetical protein